jgi:Cu-Zn family superoxide dismutase
LSAPVARAILHVFRQLVPALLLFLVSDAAVHAQVPTVGASADVRDASGRLVATADFREGRGEVLITVTFPNPPVLSGSHALHINDTGRCDPPDFATSGNIFNPFNKKHGRQNPEGSEVGDLPNVNFSTGITAYNTTAIGATLGQGPGSLLSPSRSFLIFNGEDDQKSDPDGNPGPRVACGVIQATGSAPQPAAAPAVSIASPVAAVPRPTLVTPTAARPQGVAQQPVAKPASSPVAVVKPQVIVSGSPTPVGIVGVPTPIGQLAAAQTTTSASSSGLSTVTALIIAVLGAGLIVLGYLLRQRRPIR